MASRRKGWGQLSPAYRARLSRSNITEAEYNAGHELRAARGHRVTPEHLSGYRKRADELGIGFIAPEYDELDKAEQLPLARDFVLGYMSKGKTTKARAEARLDFNSWLFEVRGGEFSRENWKAYRALYNSHFGSRQA